MAKNLMPEVAKLLGVELEEKFIIENKKRKMQAVLYADRLHNSTGYCLGGPNSYLLQDVLCGLYEVKELPWEPQKGDIVFYLNTTRKLIGRYDWRGDTWDLALKALGVVYRTQAEAEKHFAADYKKLTGKPLEV